jgi:hypothetical protein
MWEHPGGYYVTYDDAMAIIDELLLKIRAPENVVASQAAALAVKGHSQ